MSDDKMMDDSELSALYRSAQKIAPAPSAATDQAILAAAKRELHSQPVKAPLSRLRQWRVPLSLAATLVLSTSIYLSNPPLPISVTESDTDYRAEPNMQKALAPSAATLAQPGTAAIEAQQYETRAAKSLLESSAEQAQEITRQSRLQLKKTEAVAERQAALSKESLKDAAEQPLRAPLSTSGLAPSERSSSEPEVSALPSVPAMSTTMQPDYRQSPERWLDEIRRLLTQGELESVQRELHAFGIRYPEYPVPAKLRQTSRSMP